MDLPYSRRSSNPLSAAMDKIGDLAFMLVAWPAVVLYMAYSKSCERDNYDSLITQAVAIEKATQKVMKERRNLEPAALSRRRRSLSYAAPIEVSVTQQLLSRVLSNAYGVRDVPSKPSLLLSLPLEIRKQIYGYVLGNNVLHLVQLPRRLGHIRCMATHSHENDIDGDIQRSCFSPSKIQTYRRGESIDLSARSDGCLSLLQLNRQIYREASEILYQTNTFDINHPQTLHFLARTLRSNRLASIRHLQLSWTGRLPMLERDAVKAPDDLDTWERTWDIIAEKMTGLKSLKLRLALVENEGTKQWLRVTRLRWTKDSDCFERMLESLRRNVRGLKDFELVIEVPEGVTWDVKEVQEKIRKDVYRERIIVERNEYSMERVGWDFW